MCDETTQHYCLIKNFRGLVRKQTGDQHLHYCKRCLNGFKKMDALVTHAEYGNDHVTVRVKLPEPGAALKFTNCNRTMIVSFIMFADFELFIKPIDTCPPNLKGSYTNKYQKHTPSSFCYYVKCFDDKVYSLEPVAYTHCRKRRRRYSADIC